MEIRAKNVRIEGRDSDIFDSAYEHKSLSFKHGKHILINVHCISCTSMTAYINFYNRRKIGLCKTKIYAPEYLFYYDLYCPQNHYIS